MEIHNLINIHKFATFTGMYDVKAKRFLQDPNSISLTQQQHEKVVEYFSMLDKASEKQRTISKKAVAFHKLKQERQSNYNKALKHGK